MGNSIIKFPGYIDLGNGYGDGAKGYYHGCKHYDNFRAMVRDLSDRDRERTLKWHVQRDGRANYRAVVLTDKLQTRAKQASW